MENQQARAVLVKFYVDTCIVSELPQLRAIEGDLRHKWKIEQLEAFKEILSKAKKNEIVLCTCIDSAKELKVSDDIEQECQAILDYMKLVPVAKGYLGNNAILGLFRLSGPETETFHNKIMTALGDDVGNTDSHLLLTAVLEHCDAFITIDKKTILRHKEELQVAGIVVADPTEALMLLDAVNLGW